MTSVSTLFIKVERLRRLQHAREFVHMVQRGDDNSFGIGLSEDNEIVRFHHNTNAGVLRLGDQVRAVGDEPLVRERLAELLQRKFACCKSVSMHVSQTWGPAIQSSDDVFAALQLRTRRGIELDEWLTDLWTLRSAATWGASFTVPILPGAHSAWLGIHLSHLFSEPLLGCVDIPLASIERDTLDTRWYSLRAEDASTANDLEGEVLLTTRKYVSSVSVSPGDAWLPHDPSDEEPEGPINHATQPLKPIFDAPLPTPMPTFDASSTGGS